MAQAAELVRTGRAVTGPTTEGRVKALGRLGLLFSQWRERARQQRQLEGYLGLQDLGRQTGVQG